MRAFAMIRIRRPVVGHETAERVDEGAIAFGGRAGALDDGAALPRRQDQKRILAKKRVPAHVFAAFDALEQERVVGVFGDFQERRHRRQQVRDNLLAHGHKGAAAGQLFVFLKRRDFHGS